MNIHQKKWLSLGCLVFTVSAVHAAHKDISPRFEKKEEAINSLSSSRMHSPTPNKRQQASAITMKKGKLAEENRENDFRLLFLKHWVGYFGLSSLYLLIGMAQPLFEFFIEKITFLNSYLIIKGLLVMFSSIPIACIIAVALTFLPSLTTAAQEDESSPTSWAYILLTYCLPAAMLSLIGVLYIVMIDPSKELCFGIEKKEVQEVIIFNLYPFIISVLGATFFTVVHFFFASLPSEDDAESSRMLPKAS